MVSIDDYEITDVTTMPNRSALEHTLGQWNYLLKYSLHWLDEEGVSSQAIMLSFRDNSDMT